jgi:hypothetical protein
MTALGLDVPSTVGSTLIALTPKGRCEQEIAAMFLNSKLADSRNPCKFCIVGDMKPGLCIWAY